MLKKLQLRIIVITMAVAMIALGIAFEFFGGGIIISAYMIAENVPLAIAAAAVLLVISVLLSLWATIPVKEEFERQNKLGAYAAHELKNPLAAVLTNAQVIKEQSVNTDVLKYVDRIISAAFNMKDMVEDILELARMEQDIKKTVFTELDLSELAVKQALIFEPEFFENDISFTWDIDENIHIIGNEAHLTRLMAILMDNAIKYCGYKAKASLELKCSDGYLRLTVSNEGGEIPKQELGSIFKAFYRGESIKDNTQGHGLGLSIAQGIVNEHKGRIWAESINGLNSFFVEFPAGDEK